VRFAVRPRPTPELPHQDELLAGAALVDITPPPGLPKAGYSANAQTGEGFHTRLRAAITHLRMGRSSVAIVQLDLLGGSPVLQHLVAEAVADRTDVPLAGIFLGATHTHAGPGQFLGSDFYNQHASNKAGFDPAFTQFLVDRIASGIVAAHDTRVPARLAVGTCEIWGLTRNRSHDPHTQNRTVTDKRQDPQRKWVTVNPELHLLRVDRVTAEGTEPLSAAVVFSIHGTGISQKDRLYNADLWAYLTDELGHRIEVEHGHRPVVGAMEGTHADVAPALHPGLAGHREARRIGGGIGAEAYELFASLGPTLSATPALEAGFAEVDLTQRRRIDDIELPERPAVGAALVAGAKENLTPVINRLPPFRAGTPKRWGADGPQGAKWVLGSRWLQPALLRLDDFPRVMPLQVLRVGDTVVVGLPFETTVESGRRVAASARDGLGPDGATDRIVVASVVNDYWGYVATEEEYGRQFYEGGHTLYGPNTEAFVSAQVRRLVRESAGRPFHLAVAPERRWSVRARWFLPRDPGPDPGRRFERRARFVDPTGTVDGYWEQAWVDVAPAGLTWHEPIVAVESSDDGGSTWAPAVERGRRVDDQGCALAVSHLGAVGDEGIPGHRYRVRWYDPVMRAGRKHRFVLLANNDRTAVAGEGFD
jgi:neutral ceramidase